MVKLYYSATSAGAAAFLAAHVGGIRMETEQVNMRDCRTAATGADYYSINPRGTVPCLVLDDGTVLADTVAVLAYVGTLPGTEPAGVMAPLGTPGYYATLGLLAFISSELHALFAHLFNPAIPAEMKEIMRAKLQVADAYLYVVLSWAAHGEIDLDGCKQLKRYFDRLAGIPAVAGAFDAMEHNPAASLTL